jgi:SAM-dependent methyltransferase
VNSRQAVQCPICHAADSAPYAFCQDRLFGLAQGKFQLYRCLKCGCVFIDPIPDHSVLASWYPLEYWWSEASGSDSPWARLFRRLESVHRDFVTADHVRFLVSCAEKNAPRGRLLLDIGCGSGTFLHLAGQRGFVPHGMDASGRAVEIAHKQYGFPARQGEIGKDVWGGRRFDFITMFHVLEHLPDPRRGLEYARNLLEPGGILILQMPNMNSIQARVFRDRWYGLDVPRHIINFSPKALSLLLEEMGFTFEQSSRFSLRDNPASIASSAALRLDPIRRKGRRLDPNPVKAGAAEIAYFGLFLLSLPVAFLESLLGFGGTLWVSARMR